jgi:hypothetical protein
LDVREPSDIFHHIHAPAFGLIRSDGIKTAVLAVVGAAPFSAERMQRLADEGLLRFFVRSPSPVSGPNLRKRWIKGPSRRTADWTHRAFAPLPVQQGKDDPWLRKTAGHPHCSTSRKTGRYRLPAPRPPAKFLPFPDGLPIRGWDGQLEKGLYVPSMDQQLLSLCVNDSGAVDAGLRPHHS